MKWLVALTFFGIADLLLFRNLQDLEWAQLRSAIGAMEAATVVAGLAWASLAYLAFGTYDLLARHALGLSLSTARVMGTAMTAFALNLNLGALIGGWASRIRLYSRAGIDVAIALKIIGLGLLSNWSGFILIAGLCFAWAPPQLPDHWPLSVAALRAVGGLLLLGLGAWLSLCLLQRGRRHRIGRFELQVPGPGFASLQLSVSVLHWLSVCMVLKTFLPAELSFVTVLGVLLMGSLSGAATHVPAGLGVIEAVFLAALGDRVAPAQLLVALLSYRVVFYLLPLALALVAFAVLELASRRASRRSPPTAPGQEGRASGGGGGSAACRSD
jgi:uncharacterized membrane protein YbhN (UPF0104 family)